MLAASEVPAVPAGEEAVSPVETAAAPEADAPERYPMVLLAFEGTEDKAEKLWKKSCPGVPFKVVSVGDDYETAGVLPDLLIDEGIEDDFVLVPAGTFPAGRIHPAALAVPRAYQTKDGTVSYDSFFPMLVKKDLLEKLLTESLPTSSETLVKALVTDNGRAELGGISFGNAICPVTRSNPCEHVVIEAILKKIYIGCNRAGWDGIAGLIDKLIADE